MAAGLEILDGAEVAQRLCVTQRRLHTYVQMGMPVENGHKRKFVWRDALDWYVNYQSSLFRTALIRKFDVCNEVPTRSRRLIGPEHRNEVRRLLKQGKSVKEVVSETGIQKTAVYLLRRELKCKADPVAAQHAFDQLSDA